MERKIASGTMLTLLLMGMLALTFNIQPVRAEPTKVSVDYYGSPYIFDTGLVPGTQFSIDITVDYFVDLWLWQFEMYFDPDVIQGVWYDQDLGYAVEADPEGFLASEGGTVIVLPGPGWDNTLGKLWLTGAFLGDKEDCVTGGGVLARVTFEVVGEGESTLTFGDLTLLFDPEGYIAPELGHGYFDNTPQRAFAMVEVEYGYVGEWQLPRPLRPASGRIFVYAEDNSDSARLVAHCYIPEHDARVRVQLVSVFSVEIDPANLWVHGRFDVYLNGRLLQDDAFGYFHTDWGDLTVIFIPVVDISVTHIGGSVVQYRY